MNHEPTELQKCLVPDCGFETNTKGEFKAHQRTHADYKSVEVTGFVIIVTHSNFTLTPLNLTISPLIRQTSRPQQINCQLCNYKCLNKTNLAMHMQTDHSAEGKKTIQEVLENGPFMCTFCTFTAKYQVRVLFGC